MNINLESYTGLDRIPLVCDFCGISFTRTKRDLVATMRRSKYFQGANPIRCNTCAIKVEPDQPPAKCRECGVDIRKDRKFCSQSCSATYSNHRRAKKTKKTNMCRHCGNFYNKQCTPECLRKELIDNWLSGKISGNGKYSLRETIRNYVIECAGNACEICGFDRTHPVTGNPVLHVDHIDGDWKNSSRENLRVLCPNCHALTDNYGALNMGNGRKWKADYSQF